MTLSLPSIVSFAFAPFRSSFAVPRNARTMAICMASNPSDQPSKVCVFCRQPFKWRKKFERPFGEDEVTTCSKRCKRLELAERCDGERRVEGSKNTGGSRDEEQGDDDIRFKMPALVTRRAHKNKVTRNVKKRDVADDEEDDYEEDRASSRKKIGGRWTRPLDM